MNAVMDRINRLKYATKEFAAMRGAMFGLYEYHRELSNKIKDGNTLTKEQVEELIEENALNIQGSSLIDVTKNENTVTIISRTYTHEQEIASAAWVITHNLNKKPSVTVVDTAEEVQVPDNIEYNNLNTITLHFLAAFKGKAYLN